MRFLNVWEDEATVSSELVEKVRPWVHDASNPFADWYFGDAEIAAEIIGEWMERPSSEFYIGRGIVMFDDDGEPRGILIGMSGAEVAKCRMADFTAFCEEIGDEPGADEVIDQVVTASRELFPPIRDDAFYISRIAVDRNARGRGLGRQLVRYTIELKRKEGFPRVRLDVSADNVGAIRVYNSLGLETISRAQSKTAPLEYCAMALDVE